MAQDWAFLRDKRIYLLKQIAPDALIDHLYQKRVITSCEYDDVKTTRTTMSKNTKLLDCLARKADSKVSVFLECLRETEQEHIADYLQEYMASKQKGADGASTREGERQGRASSSSRKRTSSASASLGPSGKHKKVPVSDADLRKVARKLTKSSVKDMAVDFLGLADVDVQNKEEDTSNAREFNFELLQMWKSKHGDNATKEKLDGIFRKASKEVVIKEDVYNILRSGQS